MTKARDIADGVDTADIADGAISTAKLADGSISTAKIADSSITNAKISGMASSKLTGALPAISGAALTGISAGLPGPRAEVFTSSGTFTVPAGVTACKVTVVGGGGGSGCASGSGSCTGGGHGGGTAIKWITGLTPGATVAVTVGAGGAGGATSGTNGSAGGTSSFGSYCSATGGDGSIAQSSNGYSVNDQFTLPGVGSGGDLNIYGGSGGPARYLQYALTTSSTPALVNDYYSGGGGAPMGIRGYETTRDNRYRFYGYQARAKNRTYGPFGGYAGAATFQTTGYGATAAEDATGYGCGAGGADTYYAQDCAGGAGYQGIVFVEYQE